MWKNLRQRVSLYRSHKREYKAAVSKGIILYQFYFLEGIEKVRYIMISAFLIIFLSWFFYRNLLVSILFLPCSVIIFNRFQSDRRKKRQRELELQFMDFLLYLAANLRAGFSIENAFLECRKDIRNLQGARGLGQQNYMSAELWKMEKGLSLNVPLQELLQEFAARSGVEHIREFAEVFSIAVQSGGNLPAIIEQAAVLISDEISLQQEILSIISGKVFEQKIMSVIPFLLTFYVEISSPGFFSVLYESPEGRIVSTVCLICYLTAAGLAENIVRKILGEEKACGNTGNS